MAKDKKSAVVYTEWMELFNALSDDEAGRLIKHFFEYVNDLNPVAKDRITELSFIPIKQTLKRDLKKYESYIDKQKANGSKGGRPKKGTQKKETQKTQPFFEKPKKADSVNVNVNDNVNDINKDVSKPLSSSQLCIDFWLKEFKVGWEFGGQHGKAMKSIIKKIENKLKQSKKEINLDSVLDVFKIICLKLPEWYKDKDLQIIDSKFNEIITEIQKEANGITNNTKPVSKYHN